MTLEKELNTILQVAEHIGFMEANNANEYKVLELRDELQEMKSRFLDMLADLDNNSSMMGEDDG